MLFNQNRVNLLHEKSGVSLDLNAEDALRAWRHADTCQPLQVTVAKVRHMMAQSPHALNWLCIHAAETMTPSDVPVAS
jgi:hypothetical protein